MGAVLLVLCGRLLQEAPLSGVGLHWLFPGPSPGLLSQVGADVPSHLHYNLTYLVEADEAAPLRVKEDENSGLRWFTFAEALAASTEPWMAERVYKKLIEKGRQ